MDAGVARVLTRPRDLSGSVCRPPRSRASRAAPKAGCKLERAGSVVPVERFSGPRPSYRPLEGVGRHGDRRTESPNLPELPLLLHDRTSCRQARRRKRLVLLAGWGADGRRLLDLGENWGACVALCGFTSPGLPGVGSVGTTCSTDWPGLPPAYGSAQGAVSVARVPNFRDEATVVLAFQGRPLASDVVRRAGALSPAAAIPPGLGPQPPVARVFTDPWRTAGGCPVGSPVKRCWPVACSGPAPRELACVQPR